MYEYYQSDTATDNAYGENYLSIPVSATEPWCARIASAYLAGGRDSCGELMSCTAERIAWATSMVAARVRNEEVM